MKLISIIEIKDSIRNTKALRKRIYEATLEYIKQQVTDKNELYCFGFCSAISHVVECWIGRKTGRFYGYWLPEKESVYKELKAYEPKDNDNAYWFDRDYEGMQKRIKILEKIIKEM